MNYIKEIDVLRGIAIVGVLIFHCFASYDEFKIRNTDYHKMIKRFISDYHNVDFINLYKAFCDEKICLAKNDNNLL